MRAAHATASSREGSSSTVKPPSSGGATWVAALGDCSVCCDENGRHAFVDAAAEDVDAGGFRLVDHGVRVATHRLPLAFGHDHRSAGKGDQVLGDGAISFWRLMSVVERVCGLTISILKPPSAADIARGAV